MANNIVVRTFKHFDLITRHKWEVFKLACRAGIPWRGFMHDWSKYSPTEFWESVKFYNGRRSPITLARRMQGYSKAWLHHRGRNKHHPEYWYDPAGGKIHSTPVIPYKYVVEMICDNLAAAKIYNGKRWRKDSSLKYWLKRKEDCPLNEKTKAMLTETYTQVSINGIEKTINRANLKKLYKKYCGK